MSDLVLGYFSRDLDDAEFEALGQALAQDPQAALRFAEAAEQDHRRLGLPAAVPPARRSRKALLLWLLAGSAALALAWGLRDQPSETLPVERVDLELQTAAPLRTRPVPQEAPSALQVRALGAQAFAVSLSPRPKNRLAAAVHDASGKKVADLGVSAGAWAWDCRLDEGGLAPSGRYELRIEGSGRWSQWVEIRRD